MIKTIDEILQFWFGELTNELSAPKTAQRWFTQSDVFDARVEAEFEASYIAAQAGQLAHWQDSSRGSLALILLLDQIPRNIFRGKSYAFASDDHALSLCIDGIEHGYDKSLALEAKIFYYMPLEHSESIEMQLLLMEKLRGLTHDYQHPEHLKKISTAIDYAQQHVDIIEQFGRFPHRNSVLERKSTKQELKYLATAATFGQ